MSAIASGTSARFAGSIRPYDRLDLAEIQTLWVDAWAQTIPAIDFAARRPWLVAHLEALAIAGVQIRVAVAEAGAIAGFLTVDPASGHIDQICVATDWFGLGVAEALLAAARALSPDRLVLDVNADNPRAIAFYVREGFVETGRDVNPGSGLPIIRMEWHKR